MTNKLKLSDNIQQAEDKNKLIGFILVTDELEVESIINQLGRTKYAENKNIKGLFVGDTSSGDYTSVYGFYGEIPYNNKQLFKLK